MLLLGIDIGSSSIKVSLVDGTDGTVVSSASYPPTEMEIVALNEDWAEQNPETWMTNLFHAIDILKKEAGKRMQDVGAIGITYQMHGLVTVDKNGDLIRDAIIWCDSRAVNIGDEAFNELGHKFCLSHLLNSPGNFTASKLRWIKLFESKHFDRIHKIMLPGDYIAYRLTGDIRTTNSGLSEGIFWDYQENKVSEELLEFYGLNKRLLPEVVDTFSEQGQVSPEMAEKLGIKAGTPVSYRAGDQPNNAFSLNVLEPGEIAATAGTSGVVYGVTDKKEYDSKSRVNTFLHVNNTLVNPRLGVLMCLNATGILNSWMRNQLLGNGISYENMNGIAAQSSIGSDGLRIFPFGNGAERILENKNIGASFHNLNFNVHGQSQMLRALQEGIVFALNYGVEIMKGVGLEIGVVRAGLANMFLSDIFQQTFADVSGARLELYNTDGSVGAARGAGVGAGYYNSAKEAFDNLKVLKVVEPSPDKQLKEIYGSWKDQLLEIIA